MIFRKIALCCIMFMIFLNPIHASTDTSILLLSQELPFIFIVHIHENNAEVQVLPSNLTLPMPAAHNYPAALSSYLTPQNRMETKNSIEKFYGQSIDHIVYLHLDAISEKFNLPLSNYDMDTMKGTTKYLSAISKQLSLSDIFHYKEYITSDLTLQNYYDLFQLYLDHIEFSFVYASYMQVDDLLLPLDSRITKTYNKSE